MAAFSSRAVLLVLLIVSSCLASAQQRAVRVACIGNSVTYGYGLRDREATSYPAVLQQLLGSGFAVGNFGHSGATLLRKGHNPYNKTRAFSDALAFAPDIAVIHLGLNDTDPRNWPNYRDEFAGDYAWLIDTLRKINPDINIFISRMTPIFHDHPRFRSGTRDWFWQIQSLIPSIAAANKTGLIDLHTPLYSRPDLFPDALHPDEDGASILAKTVYGVLSGDHGGLQLPSIFSSQMVLQRDRVIPFYGVANSGEHVQVSFNGLVRTAAASADGRWKVEFPAQKAGGPYKITIATAKRTVELDDVLIGEVWLCSGQSNMDFPLSSAVNSKDEFQTAQRSSSIRLLNREPLAETFNEAWDSATLRKINALEYFSGTWQRCDSVSARDFSAVGYYFAQRLQKQLQVPVGIIQVAVGGSTTESWIDRYTMEHHPVLVNELYNWSKSDFFFSWVRERADTNLKNAHSAKQRHPFEPAYNFEAGMAPLTGFPIKGVLWYQGESNAHNIGLHQTLFPALVQSWRKFWGQDFPFYYVQLSSLDRPSWGHFRYSQLEMLKSIPNSGMAVSSDLGHPTDVHPRRKKEVGERLAGLALHFSYHYADIVPNGPMPLSGVVLNNEILLSFRYAGRQLKTSDGKALRGFMLVDDKGIAREVGAFIRNDKVAIPLRGIPGIVEVRYGWEPYTTANLTNEAGLPASTFRLSIR